MAGTTSGGETKDDPSGWTVDTLRAMMEARIGEMDKRYEQRFTAQQDAIIKSESATERRFESVNEFRAQLADQASRFMPRIESISRHDATAEKISDLSSRLDVAAGRTSGLDKGWALLVAAVGVAGAVIAIVVSLTP